MFPPMHIRSINVLERPTARILVEGDRPLVHPGIRQTLSGSSNIGNLSRPGGHIRSPTAMNPTAAAAAAVAAAAAAMSSGTSTLPIRPMFQGLPLSSVTSPGLGLNMNMLSAATSLAAASRATASASSSSLAIPSPLLHYPALFPSAEELKYLSMAQIQAANQAHLAGEVAKLKPPFLSRNYLELAMLVCNTFRGKLFPCPHCRYVTDRRNNLKRHVATMHQACDKQLECCGVSFSTKASLREHITIFHHNGYSCPFCGRRFCRKALLKRHLSVHSGQKDYTCPHCDYATSHKSNLERHKRIHARLQIMGASGLDDTDRHDTILFDEHDTSLGDSPRGQLDPRDSSFQGNCRAAIRSSWAERGYGGMSRTSPASHSDDQEDDEIDIDDIEDDNDDDDDSIIDACTIDSHAINLTTSSTISTTSSSSSRNNSKDIHRVNDSGDASSHGEAKTTAASAPDNPGRLNDTRDTSNHPGGKSENEGNYLPINLVAEHKSRPSPATIMASRLTNGFGSSPFVHASASLHKHTGLFRI